MRSRGFTVLELMALIVLLIVIGAVFWSQKTNIQTANRDDKRKTAINAIYYGLEKVYFPANNSYPKTLSASNLPTVDKALFNDPDGVALNKQDSDYRYEATDCVRDKCASYRLRAALENEADYLKRSGPSE